MFEHRNCLILYTTATCNLNCVYCFIDKNPALVTIDQYLNDSFIKTPDYYINFAKEMFAKDKLTSMQIWGGEPFLAMHRAYYTIHKIIEYYPNFKSFMASTNMVSDVFLEEFWGLVNVFSQYPNRKFELRIQLSCDGPQEINDVNRGQGVTDKIVSVFEQLCSIAQEKLTDNITLSFHFKPTLDANTIAKLQDKEAVIEYFQFFEKFQDTFNKINKKNNLIFSLPIPNTACPSPHTKQDGLNFTNYCKLCRQIESENVLRYYKNITSFSKRNKKNKPSLSFNGISQGHCGNGWSTLGLLPDNKLSCCHNGFVDMCADYKKNILNNNSAHLDSVTIEKTLFTNQKNALMFDKDSKEFKTYEKKLSEFYKKENKMKIANATSIVLLLANHNQIDKKYKNKEEALAGAIFVLTHTAFCVRDNLGSTGSIYLYPLGLFKLLLNGAREYIEQEV